MARRPCCLLALAVIPVQVDLLSAQRRAAPSAMALAGAAELPFLRKPGLIAGLCPVIARRPLGAGPLVQGRKAKGAAVGRQPPALQGAGP